MGNWRHGLAGWPTLVPARTVSESRWLLIGCIGEAHWSVVVAYRDLRVRIISVRCSRSEKVKIYEQDEH